MTVTQLKRLLTHLLIGVEAMVFSLKLPKRGSMTSLGLVTVVILTQTLRWDGIILLSLVGARIKTFMLVSKNMERFAI